MSGPEKNLFCLENEKKMSYATTWLIFGYPVRRVAKSGTFSTLTPELP